MNYLDNVKPTIQDCYAPLHPAVLDKVEIRIDCPLPAAYRDFLLSHNGGWFRPATFFGAGHGQQFPLHTFFSVTASGAVAGDLVWQRDILADRLPKRYLAFASSPTGDMFCFSTTGRDLGHVYYWYHDIDLGWAGRNTLDALTTSLTEFLAKQLVDPDSIHTRETMPVFRAAELHDWTYIEDQVSNGLPVDVRNEHGMTLVMCAFRNYYLHGVRRLLEIGVPIDARDAHGSTALHWAVRKHSYDGVNVLLDHGADIDARDSEARTPLIIAVEQSSPRIADLLLQRGADVYANSHGGAIGDN